VHPVTPQPPLQRAERRRAAALRATEVHTRARFTPAARTAKASR
jgi:hypothetical protein